MLLAGLYFTIILTTIQYSYADSGGIIFADWLLENGHYDNARHEYLKLTYESELEMSEPFMQLYLKIAQCSLLSGNYIQGISWCEQIEGDIPDADVSDILIVHANMLMKMGYFDASIDILSNYVFSNSDLRNRVSFYLGCAEANKWKLDNAISNWNKVSSDHQLNSLAVNYAQLTFEAKEIKKLIPAKGAIMGIVPGLGYAYAGHNQTALAAFIVIGLTTWGTIASFKNDIEGFGYLAGLLSVGWYSGSIYGSYLAVNRYNNYQRKQYINKIHY